MDDNEFEEIYKPVGSDSNTDEEVRFSRIQLSVICLHATSRDENCCIGLACSKHTSHMRAKSNKLIIDGGS